MCNADGKFKPPLASQSPFKSENVQQIESGVVAQATDDLGRTNHFVNLKQAEE